MHEKKLKTFILWCFLSIVSLVIFIFPGMQADAKSSDFFIDLIYPENQIGGEKGYFDLRVTPNQKEVLEVLVKNLSDQEKKFVLELTSATTSQNGGINYSNLMAPLDAIQPFALSKIASLSSNEITLAPNEERKVPIELEVPAEPFDGIVLGAIYVSEVPEEETSNSNFSVHTRLSMVRVIQLSENDTPLTPEMLFSDITVEDEKGDQKLKFTLENPVPMLLNRLNIKLTIANKKNPTKVLAEYELENLKVAPSSSIDCVFPLNKENLLKPGTYLIKIAATRGEKEWVFNKKINVVSSSSPKTIEQEPEQTSPKNRVMWVILAIICLLFVLIVVCFFFFVKNKKRKDKI